MARVFAFPNSVFFYAPFLLLLTACHVGGSYVNGLRSAATIVYRGRSGGRLGLSPFAREKKLATCHLVTYTSEMPLSARLLSDSHTASALVRFRASVCNYGRAGT